MRNKILPVLVVLFGALSFLLFVPGIWWLGIIFAVIGVVLGGATLKTLHFYSVVGILLVISAGVVYLCMMNTAGASIFGYMG